MDLGMNRLRDSEIKFRAYDDTLRRMMKPLTLEEIFKGNFGCTNLYQLTMMEYMGINDINGTEIYFGDVVRLPMVDNGKGDVATFVFDAPNYYLRGAKGVYNISSKHSPECYEVIGNIYEGVDGKPWQP